MEEDDNTKKLSARKREREKETKKKKSKKKSNKKRIQKEKYKDIRIIEFPEKTNENKLEEPPSSMSLFERKKKADFFIQEKNYDIENLLKYDNTNKNIQKKYLNIATTYLNNEMGKRRINIIKEKINKSGIILDENEYLKEIANIKNEKYKKGLEYINYKLKIIDTLQYFIDKNGNIKIDIAKKKLNIKKIFYFNHESEIGNNNYFFYSLAIQIELKIEELYNEYSKFYDFIIKKNLEFLKNKDFSKLTKIDKYLFQYLSYLLTDKNSISTLKERDKIKNFLEGECVDIESLKKVIYDKNE